MKLVGRVSKARLLAGELVRVPYPPFDVLVAAEGGRFHAIEDACNHAGASLAEGRCLRGGQIVCPMHGYVFELATGKLLRPRGLCADQRTFVVHEGPEDVVVWDAFEVAITPAEKKDPG